jgi:diguanylate cyclase (GGDEF)-like protein
MNKLHTSITQTLAGFTKSTARLFVDHTFKLLILLFALGIGIVLWHLNQLSAKQIEQTAIRTAEIYSEVLTTFRTLYTSEVVLAAEAHGMEISHNYKNIDGVIPLPATLSMLLGKRIGESGSDIKSRLYSDYPFPWREVSGGLTDDFSRSAWQALQKNKEQAYFRFEEVDGQASLRYATADVMRSSCVHCHNTHPDSPKRDWRVGDVRGVLEVITPTVGHIALANGMLKQAFVVISIVFIFCLACIGLALKRLRARSVEAHSYAETTAVMNRKLTKEIGTRKIAERKLEQISLTDTLTGLSNRRHFERTLAREWKRALRNRLDLTVILIDIDHFKLYNDKYGHLAGDDCLKVVANALKKSLTRPGDIIARFGGEEFIAILPETPIEGGMKIADAMRAQVESLNIVHLHAQPQLRNIVTVSIGVTTAMPEKSISPETLILTADQALYDAKHKGRNRVCVRRDTVIKLASK